MAVVLLRTAYALFLRNSLNTVGVDRIVAEADVAKTTLYRHFPSKDDLVVSVLRYHEDVWTTGWLVEAVGRRGKTSGARLLGIFDAFDEWFHRAAIDSLEVLVRAGDADDAQSSLDRVELAYECLPSLLEKEADNQDVDAYSAHDLERFECIVRAQDVMAGLTQRLIDQLLYGCVLLENEDGRGKGGSHAATLTRDDQQR